MTSGEQSHASNWRRHIWWQLLLLGVVGTIGYHVSKNYDDDIDKLMPETVVNCSTHNAQGSGYKALLEVAQKSGLSCRQFEKPYRELRKESGVLVIVAPNYAMTSHEIDQVLNWVAEGNELIYLDYCLYGSGRTLLDKLGLNTLYVGSIEDWVAKHLPDHNLLQHVDQLVLSSDTRIKGGNQLLSDKHGALMVELEHGKGDCLIASVPSLCANRRISKKSNWGNFQFMLNCMSKSGKTILFDERVHGYTSSQNVYTYLARGPAGLISAQLFLIFLIALLSLNQRFGQARSIRVQRKIASAEFINGMALTYQKAKAFDAAWAILYGSFHTRLCKALSLPPNETPENIAGAWSQATSLNLSETTNFLKASDQLQKSHINSEEQLVENIKECDHLYELSKDHLSVQPGRRLGG